MSTRTIEITGRFEVDDEWDAMTLDERAERVHEAAREVESWEWSESEAARTLEALVETR